MTRLTNYGYPNGLSLMRSDNVTNGVLSFSDLGDSLQAHSSED